MMPRYTTKTLDPPPSQQVTTTVVMLADDDEDGNSSDGSRGFGTGYDDEDVNGRTELRLVATNMGIDGGTAAVSHHMPLLQRTMPRRMSCREAAVSISAAVPRLPHTVPSATSTTTVGAIGVDDDDLLALNTLLGGAVTADRPPSPAAMTTHDEARYDLL